MGRLFAQNGVFHQNMITPGERFGLLVAIEKVDRNRHGVWRWACLCDCGRRSVKVAKDLTTGDTKSCGDPKHRTVPIGERFWRYVKKTRGCWLWTGWTNGMGYGLIGTSGKPHTLAHRLSWVIHRGPIHQGLFVLHKCDTTACVKPDHLWLGTQLDNMRDMRAKGRHVQKLTPRDVRAIRRARAAGRHWRDVAAEFGVCRSTVHYIWAGAMHASVRT